MYVHIVFRECQSWPDDISQGKNDVCGVVRQYFAYLNTSNSTCTCTDCKIRSNLAPLLLT
jgi:hypothetical protein